MMYSDIVNDFVFRTKKNLEAIEVDLSHGKEVYEVTHLINSLLGLIILPEQKFYDNLPETLTLEDLKQEGWPESLLNWDHALGKNFKNLMRLLRNGISHFHLEFLVELGELSGLKIWNINNSNIKDWEVELSIEDLKSLVEKFIEKIKELKLI